MGKVSFTATLSADRGCTSVREASDHRCRRRVEADDRLLPAAMGIHDITARATTIWSPDKKMPTNSILQAVQERSKSGSRPSRLTSRRRDDVGSHRKAREEQLVEASKAQRNDS